MAERHWTYATSTEAFEAADGFNHAAGLPRKGMNVGGGIHAPIPETYAEGALGWTDELVEVEEREGNGPPSEAFAIPRHPLHVAHEGQVIVHPVHGAMTLPSATSPNEKARGMWAKKKKNPKRPAGPPPAPAVKAVAKPKAKSKAKPPAKKASAPKVSRRKRK